VSSDASQKRCRFDEPPATVPCLVFAMTEGTFDTTVVPPVVESGYDPKEMAPGPAATIASMKRVLQSVIRLYASKGQAPTLAMWEAYTQNRRKAIIVLNRVCPAFVARMCPGLLRDARIVFGQHERMSALERMVRRMRERTSLLQFPSPDVAARAARVVTVIARAVAHLMLEYAPVTERNKLHGVIGYKRTGWVGKGDTPFVALAYDDQVTFRAAAVAVVCVATSIPGIAISVGRSTDLLEFVAREMTRGVVGHISTDASVTRRKCEHCDTVIPVAILFPVGGVVSRVFVDEGHGQVADMCVVPGMANTGADSDALMRSAQFEHLQERHPGSTVCFIERVLFRGPGLPLGATTAVVPSDGRTYREPPVSHTGCEGEPFPERLDTSRLTGMAACDDLDTACYPRQSYV
jgi:hypothetical protein